MKNKVASDKSGTAGYNNSHKSSFSAVHPYICRLRHLLNTVRTGFSLTVHKPLIHLPLKSSRLNKRFLRGRQSFPRVVRAVQNEPGISLLESINRTSTLLESSLINALYEDFGVLKEIIGDPQIDLVVPASLWIDYLSVQKQ